MKNLKFEQGAEKALCYFVESKDITLTPLGFDNVLFLHLVKTKRGKGSIRSLKTTLYKSVVSRVLTICVKSRLLETSRIKGSITSFFLMS